MSQNVRDMKQKSVSVHDFAMIPKAEIPRSSFRMEKMVKTAMGFSYLVPIMVEEVLPGDTWKAHITTVARTAVPIVPLMDNWHLNTCILRPQQIAVDELGEIHGRTRQPGRLNQLHHPGMQPDDRLRSLKPARLYGPDHHRPKQRKPLVTQRATTARIQPDL